MVQSESLRAGRRCRFQFKDNGLRTRTSVSNRRRRMSQLKKKERGVCPFSVFSSTWSLSGLDGAYPHC